jgi:TDG/mug DNA glycosylase family protein
VVKPVRGRRRAGAARVRDAAQTWSVGFPPVADPAARVLILGSLPGRRSLEAAEYYAQPQNAFWPIMGRLCGATRSLPYEERLARLRASGIALWDVLAAGDRLGSLDSAIVPTTLIVNAFDAFFACHPRIELVCFNGRKAEEVFRRKVVPALPASGSALAFELLPSTSPAFASLTFEQKLARWSAALEPHLRAYRR